MSFLASKMPSVILSRLYITMGKSLRFQNMVLPFLKKSECVKTLPKPPPLPKITVAPDPPLWKVKVAAKTARPENSKHLSKKFYGLRIKIRHAAKTIAYDAFRCGTSIQANGGGILRCSPRRGSASNKPGGIPKTTGCDGSKGDAHDGGSGNKNDAWVQKPLFVNNDTCGMNFNQYGNIPKFRYASLCMFFIIGLYTGYLFTLEEGEKMREFIPYAYLYKRDKRFAWGDGQKSFFHGPNNFVKDDEYYDPKPRDLEKEKCDEKRMLRYQHSKEELERRNERREMEQNEGSKWKIRPWIEKPKCRD